MVMNNYNEFLIYKLLNKKIFEEKYKNEILSWYDYLIATET